MRVTIWGNKVDMYQKLMKNKEALGATLIITSVNPKTYSGFVIKKSYLYY